jgi:hypothetical protein
VADQQWFADVILPGLAKVKLSEIMAACGLAKSTASMIRSGRHLAALRHWDALQKIGSGPTGNLHQVCNKMMAKQVVVGRRYSWSVNHRASSTREWTPRVV